MSVSKELTLMLPPEIFELAQNQKSGKSLSRVLLDWAELGQGKPPLEMTQMNLPSKQCVKRNVYLAVAEAQTYESQACELGLSTNAHILGLILSGLKALNLVDLPYRYAQIEDIPLPKSVKSTPSVDVSEQLLSFMNENGLEMPLSGETWCEILEFYLKALKTSSLSAEVDVSEYYFTAKQNQPKRKIKLPISRSFDAELEYFAGQSLSTRASLVTRAVVFWCEHEKLRLAA